MLAQRRRGEAALVEISMLLARLAVVAAIAVGFPSVLLAQTPPAPAQAPAPSPAPAPPPAAQAPAQKPADPFGEEVTLAAKTIVFSKGSANWDSAFETLVETFKKIQDALEKQGVKPAGPAMTIYTATDDTGFEFEAGVPVAEAPKGPLPEGLAVKKSPEGRALKFI